MTDAKPTPGPYPKKQADIVDERLGTRIYGKSMSTTFVSTVPDRDGVALTMEFGEGSARRYLSTTETKALIDQLTRALADGPAEVTP